MCEAITRQSVVVIQYEKMFWLFWFESKFNLMSFSTIFVSQHLILNTQICQHLK